MNKSILFVANVDWFFESHRLCIAKRAIADGYSVHIACRDTGRMKVFTDLGMRVHQLNFTRSKQAIFQNIIVILSLLRIMVIVRPDICHFITIKPIVFGGLLSFFVKKHASVFAVTGLGSSFLNESIFAHARSKFLLKLYKIFFTRSRNIVIFQNMSDLSSVFPNADISLPNIKLIPGSGVDLNKYIPKQIWNDEKLRIVMAARILRDKGVVEYFHAAKIISARFGDRVQFSYYGDYDTENPSSIADKELRSLNSENSVEIHPFTLEIHKILSKAQIIVLPSYREGFPKVIMEGSASGCVAIVSDAPGCSDAVVDGTTGFIVSSRSVSALVKAISYCIDNRQRLPALSKQAREHAERQFSVTKIVDEHMEVYQRMTT